MTNEKQFELLLGQRKAVVKANKTIVSLCNYIAKLTDNEKAIERANSEKKKALKAIEKEEMTDKLLGSIVELNCRSIAVDEDFTEEEKQYHINGLRDTHKIFSVTTN